MARQPLAAHLLLQEERGKEAAIVEVTTKSTSAPAAISSLPRRSIRGPTAATPTGFSAEPTRRKNTRGAPSGLRGSTSRTSPRGGRSAQGPIAIARGSRRGPRAGRRGHRVGLPPGRAWSDVLMPGRPGGARRARAPRRRRRGTRSSPPRHRALRGAGARPGPGRGPPRRRASRRGGRTRRLLHQPVEDLMPSGPPSKASRGSSVGGSRAPSPPLWRSNVGRVAHDKVARLDEGRRVEWREQVARAGLDARVEAEQGGVAASERDRRLRKVGAPDRARAARGGRGRAQVARAGADVDRHRRGRLVGESGQAREGGARQDLGLAPRNEGAAHRPRARAP